MLASNCKPVGSGVVFGDVFVLLVSVFMLTIYLGALLVIENIKSTTHTKTLARMHLNQPSKISVCASVNHTN